MKYITWLVAFTISYAVNRAFKDYDIAYSLAYLFFPDDFERAVLLSGLFSGLFAAFIYGIAFFVSGKINNNREIRKFQKEVVKSGLSAFEYAKSITPHKIVIYCDSHLDSPVHIITEKLNQLPDSKVISRPCADALIEGYTKLMELRQAHPDIFNNPDIKVNWRD